MGKYRIYKPELKVAVVLESLCGQKTDAQICREHEIAADLLSRWRAQFLERAPQLFATDQARSDEQARSAELERLIGRLTVELDAAKKLSALWRSREARNGRSSASWRATLR
jgi:transposase-like protein